MDFKFRNCSVSYFEKNARGIKYLQKISSCVNNRKIQYSVSGPVFNKFENFMILLLLFIAYFICRCLFSQAAWIWCLTASRGAEGRRALPGRAPRPGRWTAWASGEGSSAPGPPVLSTPVRPCGSGIRCHRGPWGARGRRGSPRGVKGCGR